MKAIQIVTTGVVIIACSVGGYAWMKRSSSTPAPSNEELVREVRALRSELSRVSARQEGSQAVSALRAELLALTARQASGKSVVAPSVAPNHPSQAPTDGPRTIEEERADSQRKGDAIGEKLDTELDTEERDAPWASGMEAGLKTVFDTAPTHRVMATECRTHLCRFTVQHESEGAQQSLGGEIIGKPPFDQEVFFRYDYSAKPPRTTLYVARPGTSLRDLSGG